MLVHEVIAAITTAPSRSLNVEPLSDDVLAFSHGAFIVTGSGCAAFAREAF